MRFLLGKYACAVILSSYINEDGTQVGFFLVKVNITKSNFSDQTGDQRVKGAV